MLDFERALEAGRLERYHASPTDALDKARRARETRGARRRKRSRLASQDQVSALLKTTVWSAPHLSPTIDDPTTYNTSPKSICLLTPTSDIADHSTTNNSHPSRACPPFHPSAWPLYCASDFAQLIVAPFCMQPTIWTPNIFDMLNLNAWRDNAVSTCHAYDEETSLATADASNIDTNILSTLDVMPYKTTMSQLMIPKYELQKEVKEIFDRFVELECNATTLWHILDTDSTVTNTPIETPAVRLLGASLLEHSNAEAARYALPCSECSSGCDIKLEHNPVRTFDSAIWTDCLYISTSTELPDEQLVGETELPEPKKDPPVPCSDVIALLPPQCSSGIDHSIRARGVIACDFRRQCTPRNRADVGCQTLIKDDMLPVEHKEVQSLLATHGHGAVQVGSETHQSRATSDTVYELEAHTALQPDEIFNPAAFEIIEWEDFCDVACPLESYKEQLAISTLELPSIVSDWFVL